jgi:hypothetical protein
MTRKQFQYMATEFGCVFRDIDERYTHGSEIHEAVCDYVREAVFAAKRMFKEGNSNFDADKFDDWIADVRYGRRDWTGKKVAA